MYGSAARKGPLYYKTEIKRLEQIVEQRRREAEQREKEVELIKAAVANAPQPKAKAEPATIIHYHNSNNRKYKIAEMVRIVANYFSVSEMELLGARRTKNITEARHVLYWLCRELTPYSLPEIGRRLDGRDHTTILHGIRKIDDMIRNGHPITEKCYALRKLWDAPTENYYWCA